MNQFKNKFFLISFLPALAYWYLEESYPIRIAVAGGLFLAILEVILEWLIVKKVHALSLFNFFLIVIMGAISLLGDDGIWFKLAPFFTGIAMAIFLVISRIRGKSILYETFLEIRNLDSLPIKKSTVKQILMMMEGHLIAFIGTYSIFMGYLALFESSDRWIFFKTIGQYIAFIAFSVLEMLFIRHKIKQKMKKEKENRALGSF